MTTEQPGTELAGSIDEPAESYSSDLHYGTSFEQIKVVALETLVQWYPVRSSVELELSHVDACVTVKNQDLMIVADNLFFRRFFNNGLSAIGRGAELFSLKKTVALSRGTDQLLCDGASSIEFFHIGSDCLGGLYSIQTFKRRLDEFQNPQFHILEVSRPIKLVDAADTVKEMPLSELFRLFQTLDSVDQTICRSDAQGATTKEIAAGVGLTSRSIENRRKRMLELFCIQRPMELIRITIRLEEHGLLID